jgi:cytoskeletal protein CcmA (bactofilin family)
VSRGSLGAAPYRRRGSIHTTERATSLISDINDGLFAGDGVRGAAGGQTARTSASRGSLTAAAHRRRGSIYVVVLGCAMAITVIGLSALLTLRVERRFAEGTSDFAQARLHAYSAIEDGLFRIHSDPGWRTTYPNGIWKSGAPIGSGIYTLIGEDLLDSDLSDSDTDSLVLTGVGIQGDARYKLEVTLVAQADPIEALRTAIHAGSMVVMGGKSLTATDGPVSTNGLLQLDGGAEVFGDVECGSLNNGGTISGTITVPAPTKSMPDPEVLNWYAGIATPVVVPDTIERAVLTPGYNPWGATNPDGAYLITKAGGTLNIVDSRIQGTLVIQMNGGSVVFGNAVFLQRYRSDYPVLIVDGNVEFLFASSGNELSESALATNFNPTGASYLGDTDVLQDDSYPSEIQGLVHVTGTLRLKSTATVKGVVICESEVTADDANVIVHDPTLYTSPPEGYTTPPTMVISDGSWKQVVD